MIICAGESLYDIVFTNGQPSWAVPGGSMLNVAVSAARFGEKVSLISELGDDAVGKIILGFLEANRVVTDYVSLYKGNTTIALAFLNEDGDAAYQFYHHSPEVPPRFKSPGFGPGDVLILGSFYAINPRNRSNIVQLAQQARTAGTRVYYDPNFRKPHLTILEKCLPFIRENIALADIVRGSDEDFELICGANNAAEAWGFVRQNGCQHLIYTRNKAGVEVFSNDFYRHYKVPEIAVVSTIGAGDSFNAGFVSCLHGNEKNALNINFWDEAIGRAVIFASEVCRSRENFIGHPGNAPAKL